MSICSPSVNVKEHYTCFEYDELVKIAKTFNDYTSSTKSCPFEKNKTDNKNYCNPSKTINFLNKTKK